MKPQALVVFALFLCGDGLAAKLPSGLLVCKRTDPHPNKCIKEAVEKALTVLASGNKEFDLPALDPMAVPSATIPGGTGPARITQKLTNLQFYNLARSKFEKFESTLTPTGFTLDIRAKAPEYSLKSDYELSGQILLLSVVGNGKSIITLKDSKFDIHMTGTVYEKKGKKYMNVTECDFKFQTPGGVYINYDNLFNGNKALGDDMNRIINENWLEIFKDIQKSYEGVMGPVVKNYANLVFSKFSWDDLYV